MIHLTYHNSFNINEHGNGNQLNDVSCQKKKKKLEQKGGGALSGLGTGKTPDPHSLSNARPLSLPWLPLCLTLSLSPATPPGAAAGHASPARERGEWSPHIRLPQPKLHHPSSSTSHGQTTQRTHAFAALISPPMCRNPATHLHPSLLYKLEPKIEPQTASIATQSKLGFWECRAGFEFRGIWGRIESVFARVKHGLGWFVLQ